MKRVKTVIAMSVHSEGESAVFGEGATHVRVEDDGGGPFIVLHQVNESTEAGMVRLDADELELVLDAGRELLRQEGLRYTEAPENDHNEPRP